MEGEDESLEAYYNDPLLMEKRTAEIQAAIDEASSNSSLSQIYRKELENYLDDMNEKLDSEGNTLITVPKNFDRIVEAMTREDLIGGDNENQKINNSTKDDNGNPKRPLSSYGGMKSNWYKYLMQESSDQAMNQDYDGRYSNVFNDKQQKEVVEEEKIKKGLAEIFYLDRELWKLNKQVKYINEMNIDNNSRPTSMGMDDQDGEIDYDEHVQDDTIYEERNGEDGNEDPLYTERSQQSNSIPNTPKDSTFVTKRYDSDINGSKSALNSARSTPRSKKPLLTHSGKNTPSYPHTSKPPISARSERSVPLSSRRVSIGLPVEQSREDELLEDEDEDGENSPSRAGKYGDIKPAIRKLTDEELAKVDEILSRPDEFESDRDTILTHYYDKVLQEQHEEINSTLSQYDHLSRLQVEKTEEELKTLMIAQKKKDYLAQQLIERKEKQYELKINKLLQSSTKQMIDLEAFLLSDPNILSDHPPHSPSQYSQSQVSVTTAGRSQFTKNLAELPESLEEIHPDVPITRADINQLIENLKSQYSVHSPASSQQRGNAMILPTNTGSIVNNVNASIESVSWTSEEIPPSPTRSSSFSSSSARLVSTTAAATSPKNSSLPPSSFSLTTTTTSTHRIAPKEAIQDLVSKYRVELVQLQTLRERIQTPSRTSSAGGTRPLRPTSSVSSIMNIHLEEQRAAILNAIEDDAMGLLDIDALPYYHTMAVPSLDTEDDLGAEEDIGFTTVTSSKQPQTTQRISKQHTDLVHAQAAPMNAFIQQQQQLQQQLAGMSKKKSKGSNKVAAGTGIVSNTAASGHLKAQAMNYPSSSSSSSAATNAYMEMIEKPFDHTDLQYLSNVFGMDTVIRSSSGGSSGGNGQAVPSYSASNSSNRGKPTISLPPNITMEEEEDAIQLSTSTSPEGLKLPRIPSATTDGLTVRSSSSSQQNQSNTTESNYTASRILINRRVKQPVGSYKSPRVTSMSMGSSSHTGQQGSYKVTHSTVAASSYDQSFAQYNDGDWEEVAVSASFEQPEPSLFDWQDHSNSSSSSTDGEVRRSQNKQEPEELIENIRKFVSC